MSKFDFSPMDKQYGLPPGWLNSVMMAESSGNPEAVSPKGARGLFQFMPETAKAYNLADPHNPEQSVTAAGAMFRDLFKQFNGDPDKVLAAYNWGSGNVDKKGMNMLPPETQSYIQKVRGGLPKQYASADNIMTDAQVDNNEPPASPVLPAQGAKTAANVPPPPPAAPLPVKGVETPVDAGGPAAFDAIEAEIQRRGLMNAAMQKLGKDRSFFGNMKSGAYTAMAKRGIGLMQTLDDVTGGRFFDDSERSVIPEVLKQLDAENAGTGAGGFIGELAGDPTTYLAAFGGPVMGGAMMGGISSMTAPNKEAEAPVGDRLKKRAVNTAIGTGVGAGAGYIVPKGMDKLTGLAVGITDRVLTMLGSSKAADRIVYRNYAEKLLSDGLNEEQVTKKLIEAKASGLDPTLGEATGSRGIMGYEKKLASGSGEGSSQFNDALAKRGSETIPGVLEGKAAQLKNAPTDDLYKAAGNEGNETIAKNMVSPEDAARMVAPPGGSTVDPNLLNKLTSTLEGVANGIDTRIGELGKVKNVESQALGQAKIILDNAKARGGTFESLLDAKKQLDDLFIEGANANAQKQASRYVAKYTASIDDVLKELAPQNYPAAKLAAKTTMAGRDLQTAVDNAKVGNIRGAVDAVWGSPAARDEFLRKLPSDAHRAEYTQLFNQLDNIARGFGGKQKAVAAGSQLQKDVLGVLPSSTSPLGWFPAISRAIGETFSPEVYKSAAQASLKPNAGKLTKAMQNEAQGGPISNTISAVVAGSAGKKETQPSNIDPKYTPYYEGNPEYSPLVNQILNAMGLNGMISPSQRRPGQSEYQARKERELNRRKEGGK